MRLVECFAIIRVGATTHFISTTKSHLCKPIRIGKRLAGHAGDVRVTVAQDFFGLLKC
jgi:hypothetical protein